LTIVPFIDIDHNGTKDSNEPSASNLGVRVNGGRVIRERGDSLIRIVGLEPYTDYLLTLDDKSLEQISYRIAHKNFAFLRVPTNSTDRCAHTAYGRSERMGVHERRNRPQRTRTDGGEFLFRSHGRRKASSTITDYDGSFTYLGLAPGQVLCACRFGTIVKTRLTASPEDCL
jgi:hypothetical protein